MTTSPAQQLLDDAQANLGWLVFAVGRMGWDKDRYHTIPGMRESSWSYTRMAIDLAAADITWQRICGWKS